jgi:hypothetical protein
VKQVQQKPIHVQAVQHPRPSANSVLFGWDCMNAATLTKEKLDSEEMRL